MRVIQLHSERKNSMQITVELLIQCRDNDRKAQKSLYEWSYNCFMPLCMRYMINAEDARFVLNTAFIKIIQGLQQTNIEEISFYGWSKRIITNSLIDEYRKMKLQQTHYLKKETERELEILAHETSNEADSNFGLEVLMKLIDELPELHGMVFKMYVMDDFSHKEIAEQLQISEGTSKWHLSVARKILREKIEKMENFALKKMVI